MKMSTQRYSKQKGTSFLFLFHCLSSDYAFSTAAFTGYFNISFAVAAQTALRADLAIFLAFMSKVLFGFTCDYATMSVCLSMRLSAYHLDFKLVAT